MRTKEIWVRSPKSNLTKIKKTKNGVEVIERTDTLSLEELNRIQNHLKSYYKGKLYKWSKHF